MPLSFVLIRGFTTEIFDCHANVVEAIPRVHVNYQKTSTIHSKLSTVLPDYTIVDSEEFEECTKLHKLEFSLQE